LPSAPVCAGKQLASGQSILGGALQDAPVISPGAANAVSLRMPSDSAATATHSFLIATVESSSARFHPTYQR
jgi:hypothetical protein